MKELVYNPYVLTYLVGMVGIFLSMFHYERSQCEANQKIPVEVYKTALTPAVGWPLIPFVLIALIIYFWPAIKRDW